MILKLIQTCEKIEKNWNQEEFPGQALETLDELSVDLNLTEFENQIADWIKSKELVPQLNLYNNFGEPSLTIFNNGKFALDIYFWRKNDTLIHSHGFRGAFKILYGTSLHEEFKVEVVEEFSKDLLKTKLFQENIKIMKQGDVQLINPGMKLTHRVVHLDNPTVSLCLRTVEDTSLNQWHHLSTGLSVQKNLVSQKTIKQILYAQYLLGSDSVKAEKYYLNLVDSFKSSEKISLYESLCLDQFGLSPESTEHFIEIIYQKITEEAWFGLYQDHYESLQENLQESQASTSTIKLTAHAINCGFSKKLTEELLAQISDQDLSAVLGDIETLGSLFTSGFEVIQQTKVENFLSNA